MEPRHFKPYPIPKIHLLTFKKELDHLVEIGVLEKAGMSACALPTFITPKKDGRVRWVSDLSYLNISVRRNQYPIPIIQDVIMHCDGYKYFTKLDLTCNIIPWNWTTKARICVQSLPPLASIERRLPMGLKISPNIAQSIMEEILGDLDIGVCIDDTAIFSMMSMYKKLTLFSNN